MNKINIRNDLSIADQIVSYGQTTDGLWYCKEIKVCGKPIHDANEECKIEMIRANKIIDEANKGRESLKAKAKKPMEQKPETKPAKTKSLKLKKPEVKKEISGGVNIKPEVKKEKLFG